LRVPVLPVISPLDFASWRLKVTSHKH
jgi:hypothetical protein